MSLPLNWRMNAAQEYLMTLSVHGVALEVLDGRLLLPPNPTASEIELVRLLKPELLALLQTGIPP